MDNDKIIQFDAFWKKIQKIGINRDGNGEDLEEDNLSNLAFIDFNSMYDRNGDDSMNEMVERKSMKHRQINDLFNIIWKLWSFVDVFGDEMGMSPFPISFLMDSLSINKRCILLDEFQCCLLEIIRKHCILTIAQRIQYQKDIKMKKKIKRKKAKKAKKKKKKTKKRKGRK